jgi:hypothetical protein
VLEYLARCRGFWPDPALDRWESDIQAGREPDFGANLVY